VAARMKLPLEKALLEPFFYYYLKIPANASTEHLPGKKWSGLLDSSKKKLNRDLVQRQENQKTTNHRYRSGFVAFPNVQ